MNTWTRALPKNTERFVCQLFVCILSVIFIYIPLVEAKSLGYFEAWTAHTFSDEGGVVCSMWSQPEKAEGNYKRRGEIFVFVSHRLKEKYRDQVRFELGYEAQGGTPLIVTIGARKFTFSTNRSMGWNASPQENRALVRLMRKGAKMVVKGQSKRGTKTRDTYSLSGFTAAHNAISAACKN